MSRAAAELGTVLTQAADAMESEADAVRSGRADELAAAAERKRIVLDAAMPVLRRSGETIAGASSDERMNLIQAVRRMQAAADRNAAILQGALQGARRVYACLAEAAQAAASSGTYRADGSRHRPAESVGTIQRSA